MPKQFDSQIQKLQLTNLSAINISSSISMGDNILFVKISRYVGNPFAIFDVRLTINNVGSAIIGYILSCHIEYWV